MTKERKVLFLLIALLTCPMTLLANDGWQRQAQAFLAQKGVARQLQPAIATSDYQIFNIGQRQGFVVVGNTGIIGYTTRGTFSPDSMPAAMRWWLSVASKAVPMATGRHEAVAPLLRTAWGQHSPYNDLCPTEGKNRCLTGCVATAMAQVMAFHRWPEGPTASLPAYTTRTDSLEVEALPPAQIDWNLLLPIYTKNDPQEQRLAVATLMRYCGQAVGMDYRPTFSGAYLAEAAQALQQSFGYDDGVRQEVRSRYTIAQWDSLISHELYVGRPVIYAGQSASNAHAFVVDGCDADGLFHIDWGWTGDYNGYFHLHFLKPNDNDYSQNCTAVVGIRPPDDEPFAAEPPCLTGRALAVDGMKVRLTVVNLTTSAHTFSVALATSSSDGTLTDTIIGQQTHHYAAKNGRNISIDAGQAAALQGGTYRLVPVCREHATDPWQPMFSSEDYVEAVMATTGEGLLVLHPRPDLRVADQWADGLLLPYQPVMLTLLLRNEGEDFTGHAALMACRTDSTGLEEPWQVGSALTALGHGDEQQLAFESLFRRAGDYRLWIEADGRATPSFPLTIAPDVEASIKAVDGPRYTGCPVSVDVLFRCAGPVGYEGEAFLWPGERPGVAMGRIQVLPCDSLLLRGSVSFADTGTQQLTVTGSSHREHIVAEPVTVHIEPFVETEAQLSLSEPMALLADTIVAAYVRNEASEPFVGYLFFHLKNTDNIAVASASLMVALPAGQVSMLQFAIPSVGQDSFWAELWCQDFGSSTPYGTTHQLTTVGGQLLSTGIAAHSKATTRPASTLWTTAGRPASLSRQGIVVGKHFKRIVRITK
ncbi:MAG: C10 family peptidase [Prevotella sp.]|nr:C10 family peptidase [Prevotella sp.]